MPVGATVAAATVSAGASIAGGKAKASAGRHATAAAKDTASQQTQLFREINAQRRRDFEPFRQMDIQRANAFGEIFGFDKVGDQQSLGGSPGQSAIGRGSFPDPRNDPGRAGFSNVGRTDMAGRLGLSDIGRGGFGRSPSSPTVAMMQRDIDKNINLPAPGVTGGRNTLAPGGGFNGDGIGVNTGFTGVGGIGAPAAAQILPGSSVIPGNQPPATFNAPTAPGQFGINSLPTIKDPNLPAPVDPSITSVPPVGTLPGGAIPQPALTGGLPPAQAPGPAPLFDPSLGGADRINNSLFAAAGQSDLNRQRSAIDNTMAAQGLAFSGARLEADSRAGLDVRSNVLSNYLNALAGLPTSSSATQAIAQGGAQMGAGIGNALGNAGLAAQNAAFNRGQSQSDMFGGLASSIGSGIGAFGG